MLHVDAYLVLTAGVEFEFHESVTVLASQHLEAGHGKLTFLGIIGDVDFVFGVLGEIGAYGAFVVVDRAFNHSHIGAIEHHVVPVVLHSLLSFDIFGEHHQAGSVAVEAMHHKDFLARVDPFHILFKDGVGGTVFYLVIAH